MHFEENRAKMKTYIFLPCCQTKQATGNPPGTTSMQAFLDATHWTLLNIGRRNVARIGVKFTGNPTAALHLYTGRLWSALENILPQLRSAMNAGYLEIFIVSAGYGVLHGLEDVIGG